MKAIVLSLLQGALGLFLGGNKKPANTTKIFSIVRKPTSGNLFAILLVKVLTHANIREIKITIG